MVVQINADTYINPETIEAIRWDESRRMLIYHPAAGEDRCFWVSADREPLVCRALNIIPPRPLRLGPSNEELAS